MTTDPFATAASAEAHARWPMRDQRSAFEDGARWARRHLAAQEPIDAEVEAAARALVARVHATAWDHLSEETRDVNRGDAHAALTAAKEARR